MLINNFCKTYISVFLHQSRDSSLGIATGYGLDGRGSVPVRGKIFLFSIAPGPALEPIQSHIQWIPVAVSPGQSGRGVKLTTYLHLVPRSRMVEL
jgi:hypothetical protein